MSELQDDFPHLYDPIKFDAGLTIIAEFNKDIVGTIRINKDEKDEMKYWLNTFSVKNDYRSLGIGSTLLNLAIVLAQVNKATSLHLITLANHSLGDSVMLSARRLYAKFGFEEYKRQHVD